jgi:hypothetical protein
MLSLSKFFIVYFIIRTHVKVCFLNYKRVSDFCVKILIYGIANLFFIEIMVNQYLIYNYFFLDLILDRPYLMRYFWSLIPLDL